MKREGRQHGVVRSYPIVLPTDDPLSSLQKINKRHVKTVDSALVTGIFTKVSRKPTNQSKFTGKCGKAQCLGCHIHPATKSKDKTKGTMKMRSIGSDHGRIGYPVGTSATGVLDELVSQAEDVYYDYDCDRDYDYHSDYGYHSDYSYDSAYGYCIMDTVVVRNEEEEEVRSDEYLSYCDVGLRWGDDAVQDDLFGDADGWYLVGHSQ